jgi:hypothetical protein
MVSFSSPFDALFPLQRALEASLTSGWLAAGTAGLGSFPPINVFQRDDDLVAIVELPSVDRKASMLKRRRVRSASPEGRRSNTTTPPASTVPVRVIP